MSFPQMLPVALIAVAQAQIPSTPGLPVSSPAREPSESAGDAVVIALVVVALIMIIDVAMRILDRTRRREADGIHLQTRISDALLREPPLTGTPPDSPRARLEPGPRLLWPHQSAVGPGARGRGHSVTCE